MLKRNHKIRQLLPRVSSCALRRVGPGKPLAGCRTRSLNASHSTPWPPCPLPDGVPYTITPRCGERKSRVAPFLLPHGRGERHFRQGRSTRKSHTHRTRANDWPQLRCAAQMGVGRYFHGLVRERRVFSKLE